MSPCRFTARVGLIAVVLFGAADAAWSQTLRAGGVGAATAMLPHLFAAFEHSEEIKPQVIPSLGSTGGLSALSAGILDLAVSGRALKPEELAQGLTQRLAIRTPFVLVTSHTNPNGFKRSEIAGVFTTVRATWVDGTPIRIILRPRSDSDTAVLGGSADARYP